MNPEILNYYLSARVAGLTMAEAISVTFCYYDTDEVITTFLFAGG
jgi:hypothetical protein